MSQRDSTILNCPICRYDLAGLPARHRCPECGFEYDESMRIWSVPPQAWWRVGLMGVVGLAGLVAVVYFDGFRRPVGQYLLILTVATAPFVWYLLELSRGPALVVSDRGLLLIGGLTGPRFIPWSEVWVPDPDQRWDLPPWALRKNDRLAGAGRLRRVLACERGWPGYGPVVFRPPYRGWESFSRGMDLRVIRALPRDAQRMAMREIRRQWEQATRQNDIRVA